MDEVLALHINAVGGHSDAPEDAIRDRNLLESALTRPRMAAYYEGADLFSQLLWGLVQDHPFHDGNKRTGWIAMRTFLALNSWRVSGTEDEHFHLVVSIAQGMALDEAETWLREHVVAVS